MTLSRSLLKILDNLQLADNSPLRLQAQSWLVHSLTRGDLTRLLEPIFGILLEPATCRLSVLHVNIQHSNTILTRRETITEDKTPSETQEDVKIYAISSVDGNVIYHVSDDKIRAKDRKKRRTISTAKVI